MPRSLLVIPHGGPAVRHAIDRQVTRLGRSPNSHLFLDDGKVSRRHALIIVREDGGAEIVDDRSLNGTFVNGHRIHRQLLQDGDVIGVGRHRLRFLEHAELASETEEVGAPEVTPATPVAA